MQCILSCVLHFFNEVLSKVQKLIDQFHSIKMQISDLKRRQATIQAKRDFLINITQMLNYLTLIKKLIPLKST